MQPEQVGQAQLVDAAGCALAKELAELRAADLHELRLRFGQLYRCPAPETLSRDLIARLVAHRMQERRLGGLNRTLVVQLDRLAKGQPTKRRFKPGTVLVREYEGAMYEVMILSNGFLWNGQTFASLSTIARKITGTVWSGPRFFGLQQNGQAASDVKAHSSKASEHA